MSKTNRPDTPSVSIFNQTAAIGGSVIHNGIIYINTAVNNPAMAGLLQAVTMAA